MQGTSSKCVLLVCLFVTACGGGGGGGGKKNSGSSGPESPRQIPQGDLSISGTLSVSAANAVDLDTGDPNAPPHDALDNDLPFEVLPCFTDFAAQLIPSPGTVGGHLEYKGTKVECGFIVPAADTDDFYRASLAAGQVVSLTISDFVADDPFLNDFDLLLLDLNGVVVDTAAGLGPVESIVAPYDGEFFILVTACASDVLGSDPYICGGGTSNYLLSIGQGLPGVTSYGPRLSSEFVPGEALVRYENDATADNGERNGKGLLSAASAVNSADDRIGDVWRVSLSKDVSRAGISSVRSEGETSTEAPVSPFRAVVPAALEDKLATLAAIKSLQRRQDVGWAEPNYIRLPQFEPNDPGYVYQWHYPLINLPAAWDLGLNLGLPAGEENGGNVTVAVLDTGILPLHPDFQNQEQIDLVTGGWDLISDPQNSLDGDGVDDDPTDPGDGGFFGFSSSFHGTHVAGTIAAATDNEIGAAGVSYNSNILPVRVLGRFGGTSFDISQGLCFAAGLSDGSCEGAPANPQPADIINMSLGGTGSSLSEQLVVDAVVDSGVIIVAAAGNSSSSAPFYPAAYDGVIAVSAVDISGTRASYSNFGPYVDVAAPGGETSGDINGDGYPDGVLSMGGDDSGTTLNYTYPFFQGTSMAAPHVAGVFALMRSANGSLDTADIEFLLETGALTAPVEEQSGRNDQYGYGLIDAQKAVSAAIAAGGAPPTPQPWLGVVPGSLNYGATLDTLQLNVRNNSGGILNVASIASDQTWLVAPEIKSGDGLGIYDVTIDRSGLGEGSYSGILTFTSDVPNVVEVPVIMQVNNSLQSGDVGHLYIRLIDPFTGEIREVEADAVDGKYVWQINNLPSGNYQLVAFSDADDDDEICDSGEACGSYLTTDQPILIDLQTDTTGVDFPVNYGASLDLTIPAPKD